MKTLKIGDKEYVLEFAFDAAQNKDCVNRIFKMVSGGYLGKQGITGDMGESKSDVANAMVNGVAEMYAEIPETVIAAFYAGLMENNAVSGKVEAKKLLKQYFKENPDDESATFMGMYNLIRECMEDDGFFKLTGLDKMLLDQKKMAENQKSESLKTTGRGKK